MCCNTFKSFSIAVFNLAPSASRIDVKDLIASFKISSQILGSQPATIFEAILFSEFITPGISKMLIKSALKFKLCLREIFLSLS